VRPVLYKVTFKIKAFDPAETQTIRKEFYTALHDTNTNIQIFKMKFKDTALCGSIEL